MEQTFKSIIKDKNVLFITTKNIDYIRNTQEVKIIHGNAREIKLLYSKKKNYIGRIIEIWCKLFVMNLKEIDVVFVGFAPQLILPFFAWKLRKKIIVIDFFISVYDTLIHDRKKFKDGSIVAKFSHVLDKNTIDKAQHVITDTKADAKYFIEEFNSDDTKFETLYLEADTTIYYPREQHKREDLQDKFVVLYFGSILPLQGVEIVLDAIRLMKDDKKVYFQIIGPIPKNYDKPIQANVEYIDWLSQQELAQYIANADLCLAGHFSSDIDKAKRTIAGKTYIYSAMKKKIILGDNDANRELFEEKDGVYYIKMGSVDEVKKKVLLIKNI